MGEIASFLGLLSAADFGLISLLVNLELSFGAANFRAQEI
jgi:hypothetical protein